MASPQTKNDGMNKKTFSWRAVFSRFTKENVVVGGSAALFFLFAGTAAWDMRLFLDSVSDSAERPAFDSKERLISKHEITETITLLEEHERTFNDLLEQITGTSSATSSPPAALTP